MNNFDYMIPTTIHFGKGQISRLGEEISRLGKSVLLVYGGGSIKKAGIYEKVMEILKEQGAKVTELSGVEPNPRIESVRRGVELCRQNNVDVILAVGGGSTIDCSKAVAAGVFYDGDAWDIVLDDSKITEALPIVTVLTLSATGSEMNGNAVISNMSTNEKLGIGSDLLRPRASILDPEYTYTVSKKQTAAGTADIMSHVFEIYFTNVKDAFLQARLCEAVLKTCIRYGGVAVEKPDDYEARANLMWASSLALNSLLSYGAEVAWTVHPMEHELSAFYDITHGEGLAILTPHWMKYCLSDKTVGKFAEYGVNVWGIDEKQDAYDIANQAIGKTREFFNSLGLPATLRDVGIDEKNFAIMAKKAVGSGLEYAFVDLKPEDVEKIYQMAL